MIDIGVQLENLQKKGATHSKNVEQDGHSFEWVCCKAREQKTHSDEQSQGGTKWKPRRLDLPPFNGLEPDEWILKAETYFSLYQLSERKGRSIGGLF